MSGKEWYPGPLKDPHTSAPTGDVSVDHRYTKVQCAGPRKSAAWRDVPCLGFQFLFDSLRLPNVTHNWKSLSRDCQAQLLSERVSPLDHPPTTAYDTAFFKRNWAMWDTCVEFDGGYDGDATTSPAPDLLAGLRPVTGAMLAASKEAMYAATCAVADARMAVAVSAVAASDADVGSFQKATTADKAVDAAGMALMAQATQGQECGHARVPMPAACRHVFGDNVHRVDGASSAKNTECNGQCWTCRCARCGS